MAYFIVAYDICENRVNKVRKIFKKYLNWVQNSVFEGEISEGKFATLKYELMEVIDIEEDSVYFYRLENRLNYVKTVIGIEKNLTDNII